MSTAQILLVEDETNLARGLLFNLEAEGYRVTHVATGEDALETAGEKPFDLVVLDLMLPGIQGLEVCRELRRRDEKLPILILTARSDDRDRVNGLAEGADDYLTKPFNLEEFLLRVKGMLRRSEWYREEAAPPERVRFGTNVVDLREGTAETPQGELILTDLEIRMLRIFFQNEGEILSRSELLEKVWGMAPDTETRTLDNFIVRLRRYFEPDPSSPVHFLTVRGRGYRFLGNKTRPAR